VGTIILSGAVNTAIVGSNGVLNRVAEDGVLPDWFRHLHKKFGTAIMFITHDLGVIAQMASFVMVMYLGLVMEQGPVDAIFHAPKHPYTQALLRSIPSVSSQPRAILPTISGSIPHPFNKPTGCPFHPRCAKRMPGRCDKRIPALEAVGQDQRASCFLYHDVEVSE
jgi:peptide/nickel transport system ATP-binding protein